VDCGTGGRSRVLSYDKGVELNEDGKDEDKDMQA